jgi:4-hydroxy-3-polyprenylbenzoate decarboxylase
MADLAAEGAVILPASPGFYAGSKDVSELVDFIAAKVLDVIGVPHTLSPPLGGPARSRERIHRYLARVESIRQVS